MATKPAKEDDMRRHLPIAISAILLLGFAGTAGAEEFHGWVYNGLTGWGRASSNGFEDSALSSNPSIGYRWGVVGVELGYDWTGKLEHSHHDGTLEIDARQRVKGWTAGLDFNHDFAPRWSMQARAGLFRWDVDTRLDDHVAPELRFKDSGNDWYAGASVEWQWRKRTSLGLGYTHYKAGDTDIDVVGFASEHRFGGGD